MVYTSIWDRFSDSELQELLTPDNTVAVFAWMVMGDGNISFNRGIETNAYFRVSHVAEHNDYIDMKRQFLERFISCSVSTYYNKSLEKDVTTLRTKSHPLITSMYKRTYLEGRKVIQPHTVKLLTPLALAILYQDDGSYGADLKTTRITKYSLSIPEQELISKGIVDRWGIIFRVIKAGNNRDGTPKHLLRLRLSDRDRFFDLIRPYVVPSMLYKIVRGGRYVPEDVLRPA